MSKTSQTMHTDQTWSLSYLSFFILHPSLHLGLALLKKKMRQSNQMTSWLDYIIIYQSSYVFDQTLKCSMFGSREEQSA